MTARDRMVIVVVLVVAAIAGAWLKVVQPKRNQAASLGSQVTAEQSQLASARAQLSQSQAARREFAGEYAEMVRLGEAVPTDDNVPSLIYQIQSAAGQAHVDFRSLQVSAQAGVATPAAGASSASSSASQSASSQLPPGVAVGPAGFPAEQFSFSFQGNFFHLSDFFNRLEQFVTVNGDHISIGGRLITVNAISFAAAPQGFPLINANISATTYMLPASQGLVAGASPMGPAAGGVPASTQTSSSSTTGAPAVITPTVR